MNGNDSRDVEQAEFEGSSWSREEDGIRHARQSTPSDPLGRLLSGWLERRPTGAPIAFGLIVLSALLTSHAVLAFNPAFRPLYVLPLWLATRLGGKLPGLVLAVCTTLAATLVEHFILASVVGRETLTFFAVCIASLGAIMLLVARFEESLTNATQLASRDPLTGIMNRRALIDEANRAIRVCRGQNPFTAALIDVDAFKVLNDQQGHAAGDEVLRQLSQVLEESTRSSDLVARMGGDEFVVLLRDVNVADAWRALYRIEERFEMRMKTLGFPCTLSVGMASGKESGLTIEQILNSADQSMYTRKVGRKAAIYQEDGPEVG